MKLTQVQIKELKKLLDLRDRDRLLDLKLRGLNKEYDKLIIRLKEALQEAETLTKVNNRKPTKKWLIERFRGAFEGFLKEDLIEYLGNALYEIYTLEHKIQSKILNVIDKPTKSKEQLKEEFIKENDYWGKSYEERIRDNHKKLMISIIANYLLTEVNVDSLIKGLNLEKQIKSYAQKQAEASFVTQATNTETKARDDVLNQTLNKGYKNKQETATKFLSGSKELDTDNSSSLNKDPVKPLKIAQNINDDLIAVWIAIKDELTCNDCASRNGVIYDLDNLPKQKPPLHANCRCKLIYTTKNGY